MLPGAVDRSFEFKVLTIWAVFQLWGMRFRGHSLYGAFKVQVLTGIDGGELTCSLQLRMC